MNRLIQCAPQVTARLPSSVTAPARRYSPWSCAMLIGVGASLLLAGSMTRFESLFGRAHVCHLVVAGGLICLAVGPLIPLRVAAWLGGRRPLVRGAALGDAQLMWAMLAVFSLLAGLAAALMPTWLPLMMRCCEWLVGGFLWTPRILALVRLLEVTICLLPVLTPLGMAMSCLHRLAAPDGGWNVTPLGCALVGAGLGVAAADLLGSVNFTSDATHLAASLPILLVAGVAGYRAGGSTAGQVAGAKSAPALPDLRDHSPALIRLTAAWLAVAAAAFAVVWPQVWVPWFGLPVVGRGSVSAVLAALAGLGLVVCERSKRHRSPSMGGLGLACAVSGVAVAMAAALPAAWPSGAPGIAAVLVPGVAAAAALLAGYTAGYGQLAVLCRVGSRAASGAALLCVSLAGGAVVLLAVPPATGHPRTSFAQLAAVALSLAAVGGAVVIHEPTYSPRSRRWRLAAVAVCVILMMSGLPIAGRRWAGWSQALPLSGVTLHTPVEATPASLARK